VFVHVCIYLYIDNSPFQFPCADWFSTCAFWPASPSTDPLLTYPLTPLISYYYGQLNLQELYMSHNLSTPKDNIYIGVTAMSVNSIRDLYNLVPQV